MTKGRIKTILERALSVHVVSLEDIDLEACFFSVVGIDVAAEAIAALPVDRVAAVAALTHYHYQGEYNVPSGGSFCYSVKKFDSVWRCDCSIERTGDCDHVRAVEMFIAAQRGRE